MPGKFLNKYADELVLCEKTENVSKLFENLPSVRHTPRNDSVQLILLPSDTVQSISERISVVLRVCRTNRKHISAGCLNNSQASIHCMDYPK